MLIYGHYNGKYDFMHSNSLVGYTLNRDINMRECRQEEQYRKIDR